MEKTTLRRESEFFRKFFDVDFEIKINKLSKNETRLILIIVLDIFFLFVKEKKISITERDPIFQQRGRAVNQDSAEAYT